MTKQRLVGALVLGSLALILVQLLLDGEGVERPPLSVTTPPAPAIDTATLPEPTRPDIIDDSTDAQLDLAGSSEDAAAPDADASPLTTGSVVRMNDDEASVASADTADGTAASSSANEAALAATTQPAETTAPATTRPATTASSPAPATPPPAANVAVTTPGPAQAEPAPRSISTPALDASGLPEAWTVRLGSFGNRANADALVARLLAAGHKAHIRPVQTGQGTLSGVFVGPVATRNEASALQGELKSRFQINDAIVQRYNIAE